MPGKGAIVTGSSRGIGQAIAEQLADHGARVVTSSRKQDACDKVATAINDNHSAETTNALAASISEKEQLAVLFKRTKTALEQVDILACNAGSNPNYVSMAGL